MPGTLVDSWRWVPPGLGQLEMASGRDPLIPSRPIIINRPLSSFRHRDWVRGLLSDHGTGFTFLAGYRQRACYQGPKGWSSLVA